MYGVPFPYYDTLEEIHVEDKATGDLSESFAGAINSMDVEISRDTFMIESDDEDEEEDSRTQTTQSKKSGKRRINQEKDTSSSSKKPKLKEFMGKGMGDNTDDKLVYSFNDATLTFGKIFENINTNIGTMASAWAKAKEREQNLDDKVNKVLEEVMKLDVISSEDLEVAKILMAEEHKVRIFYQAPSNLKKQYVLDLLKKK